jgi:hypothetical protein
VGRLKKQRAGLDRAKIEKYIGERGVERMMRECPQCRFDKVAQIYSDEDSIYAE